MPNNNYFTGSFETLPFIPERSGYSANQADGVISVELDGGASRRRQDVIGKASNVSVQWRLTYKEYDYFRAFLQLISKNASKSFRMGLILDSPDVTEYTCKFVPDSVSVSDPSGAHYIVTAQLEVLPNVNENYTLPYLLSLRSELGISGGFQAYNFDGVDDHISFEDLQLSADFTIGFFYRFKGQVSSNVPICGGPDLAGDANEQSFVVFNQTNQRWQLSADGGVTQGIFPRGEGVLFSEKLYHVAIVRQGTNLAVYVNGRLRASDVRPASLMTLSRLGQTINDVTLMRGLLYQFSVFDRALSSEEIQFLYDGTGVEPTTNPQLKFLSNEGVGNQSFDTSPNENHGSIIGHDEDEFFVDERPSDKWLSYDFRNNIGNNVTFTDQTFTGDFSFGCWFNHTDENNRMTLFGGTSCFFMFDTVGVKRWRLNQDTGGSSIFFANEEDVPVVGTWQHVMLVRNGSTLSLLLDGVVVQTRSITTMGNLTVSRLGSGLNGALFCNAKIRDACFFNRALTDAEVQFVKDDGASGDNPTAANLQLRFKADETAGAIAYDVAGNANGTIAASQGFQNFHAIEDAPA